MQGSLLNWDLQSQMDDLPIGTEIWKVGRLPVRLQANSIGTGSDDKEGQKIPVI